MVNIISINTTGRDKKQRNKRNIQQKHSRSTKESPTEIVCHSSQENDTQLPIEQQEDNITLTCKQSKSIHFRDEIQKEPEQESTRILFQNVNGLELNKTPYTVLQTCKGMQDNNIDIVCLAETNTN